MKKFLLSLSCLAAVSSFAQDCNQIFISEYVEGRGNNKAIEIYNPTDNAIDMSQYYLQRYSNGSTTASAQNAPSQAKTIQLVGTVPAKSTIVYVIDLRNPNGTGQTAPIWTELEAKGDHFLCPTYDVNNVMYFNGNDGLLLAKGNANSPLGNNDVLCDVFGKIGEDPEVTSGGNFTGWSTVAPFDGTSNSPLDKDVTADHSLIRKQGIKKGHTPMPFSFVTFNPLLQWDSIPATLPKVDPNTGQIVYQADGVTPQWVGNWETLGWHACECDPASVGVETLNLDNIKLFPNPSTGVFTINGLENVVTIEVYNSLGQEITSIKNNTKSTVSFDLTEKTGIYMVTITDLNGRSATQKVVVK